MKKLLTLFAALPCGLIALAEGGSSASVDTSAVDTLLTGIKGDLTAWVSSAVPVLGGIAAAFLVFWLVKVVFRVIKGWANKAG